MIRRPPRSTLFPTRRSSDLAQPRDRAAHAGHDQRRGVRGPEDRKSTRLNSSHVSISYAVFCLKKKTFTEPDDFYNVNPDDPSCVPHFALLCVATVNDRFTHT